MRNNSAEKKELVLIGGGHSHALLLRDFALNPDPLLSLTLISPEGRTPYSGMLTGAIAGFYDWNEIFIDLASLCQRARCRMVQGRAAGVEFAQNMVQFIDHTGQEKTLQYDFLSIDCGAEPDHSVITGAESYAHAVKPVDKYIKAVQELTSQARASSQLIQLVQVGGGAAGCECLVSLGRRLERETGRQPRMTLIEAQSRILPEFPEKMSRRFVQILSRFKTRILVKTRVCEVKPGFVVTDTGQEIASDFTSLALPPRPAQWVRGLAIEHAERGFLSINDQLQTSVANVFASGDVALNPEKPLPRAGVFAVRQAMILNLNLRAIVRGEPLKAYEPQKSWLSLIIDGDKRAIGLRGKLVLPNSRINWWLKDNIDRRFMQKLNLG